MWLCFQKRIFYHHTMIDGIHTRLPKVGETSVASVWNERPNVGRIHLHVTNGGRNFTGKQ